MERARFHTMLMHATMPRSIPRKINKIRRRMKVQRDFWSSELLAEVKVYEAIMYFK